MPDSQGAPISSPPKERDVYRDGLPSFLYKDEASKNRSILRDIPTRREIPWIYLVVVAGAPVAHWLVTASTMMKTKRSKHLVWGLAGGATAWMVWNRLVLWKDAGYPGNERPKSERFVEYDEKTGKAKKTAINIKMLMPV